MTEGEFIRFYKTGNLSRSYKEAKEKINLFWDVLLKALEEDKKVVLKDWGMFEKREVKPRKILIPAWKEVGYTETKEVIKFKAGKGFLKIVNGDIDE